MQDSLNGFSSRSDIADISTSSASRAYLKESGREGTFLWSGADWSALVTKDTNQGLLIPPTSDATGASGAWIRQFVGEVDAETIKKKTKSSKAYQQGER